MPVPAINFKPVYDIHLVGGQTLELLPLVQINGQSATTFIANNANISVCFEALFKGSPSVDIYAGLGISLNT